MLHNANGAVQHSQAVYVNVKQDRGRLAPGTA